MAKLHGLRGRDFSLTHGETVIGRDANRCQIVLKEPFVSRLQAVIRITGHGEAFIKNLSSRKTTFVNGESINDRRLSNGDAVEFGADGTVAFTFTHDRERRDDITELLHHSSTSRSILDETVLLSPEPQIASSVVRVELAPRLRLGRADDNDIVLDSLSVSRYHAELLYGGDSQPEITDSGSTNGTFVNGQLLKGGRKLRTTDWVAIGSYLLKVEGQKISKQDLGASRITAFNLSKAYGDRSVLQDVSVALFPREFVGLMGASGCGKSTLIDALNGMRPATSGSVFVNELDLYRNFDLVRRSIGYVPQRDILHESLTVERTLYYAARMRLPNGRSREQLVEVISDVIQTVGLQEQRHNAFRELSGGQRKRLSLGIELITKPSFLFLDEPTSPLDPDSTVNMMRLFRRLADGGRIVVMVTHKFEEFDSMHNIVLLTKGGRLAFFGPPREALNYFGCKEPSEIYRRLHDKTPQETSRAFQGSPFHDKYVGSRFNEFQKTLTSPEQSPLNPLLSRAGEERRPGIRQWWVLAERVLEIKLNDLRNTLILLAQAPIIALILAFITGNTANDERTIFISAVIAIWLGANNAIREIVAETGIYARERLVNLRIPSYVLSKFAILSGVGAIQIFLFVVILVAFDKFDAADFAKIVLILYATLLAGAAAGLFFSAVVSSTEKAMSVLPLIIIPQMLLSGFLKPLDDLYVNVAKERPATAVEYDNYQRDKDKEFRFDPNKQDQRPPEPLQKSDGLGGMKLLADLMIARWTIDALVHQVSIDDPTARDRLAARMTVNEYQRVLNKEPDADVVSAYNSRVRWDLLILSGCSILFLLMTMLALKRKDSL